MEVVKKKKKKVKGLNLFLCKKSKKKKIDISDVVDGFFNIIVLKVM